MRRATAIAVAGVLSLTSVTVCFFNCSPAEVTTSLNFTFPAPASASFGHSGGAGWTEIGRLSASVHAHLASADKTLKTDRTVANAAEMRRRQVDRTAGPVECKRPRGETQ